MNTTKTITGLVLTVVALVALLAAVWIFLPHAVAIFVALSILGGATNEVAKGLGR